MDTEDRRRYFVISSVIIEIVQPILRTKLENEYTGKGFTTLQDLLSSQPVLHTLYHLRHKGICCIDSANCPRNRGALPLNYYQWDLMYAENPGPANHHCHCRFTARSVLLSDLDITLSSLILLNCFPLSNVDTRTIENLRTLKNNYLSHNIKGAIKEPEYRTIWTDLSIYIHHLDSTKQDDLIRIEQRPLDADLCHKYNAELLGMHQRLDEIGSSLSDIGETITTVDSNVREIHNIVSKRLIGSSLSDIGETITTVDSNVREILNLVSKRLKPSIEQRSIGTEVDVSYFSSRDKGRQYRLGQDIFFLHHQIDIPDDIIVDMVVMDDGRLVMTSVERHALLIYDTKGLPLDVIELNGQPWSITAVNTHTVAFKCYIELCNAHIVLYDINSKVELKSFRIHRSDSVWSTITTVDNHLVVPVIKGLLIVDYHTEQVVQTIHTDYKPDIVHGAGGKIYCNSWFLDHAKMNLYCYSITGQLLFMLVLPSHPSCMTSLNDGSLYVGCYDGSIKHVSEDGKKYKTVKNIRLYNGDMHILLYNQKREKLWISSCSLSWNSPRKRFTRVYHKK